MRHLDLFSGIGGFSLAASWAWGDEHEVVAFCEIDPFCQKVLRKHWPDVPIINDVKIGGFNAYTNVDVLTGGYPCQAFSSAARGRNIAEDLSGYMRDIIDQVEPRYIIAENVQAATIQDFKEWCWSIGYRAFARCFSAQEIGAEHRRDRWFAIAYPHSDSEFQGRVDEKMAVMRSVPHATWGATNYARTFRVSDGVSHRMDRLRALGNAIVPQVAAVIMAAIKETEENTEYDPKS